MEDAGLCWYSKTPGDERQASKSSPKQRVLGKWREKYTGGSAFPAQFVESRRLWGCVLHEK